MKEEMENQKDLLIKDIGANRSEVVKNFKVLLERLKQTNKQNLSLE